MKTESERARSRATNSHLRAIYHAPAFDRVKGVLSTYGYYRVHNLKTHAQYTVWYNLHREAWECTCPSNNLKTRCKHQQRVMDREEKRIRNEALSDGC